MKDNFTNALDIAIQKANFKTIIEIYSTPEVIVLYGRTEEGQEKSITYLRRDLLNE